MTLRRRWPVVAVAAAALVAVGSFAYAAIPDAGGVIHTCYTKSSGAWRVIDTGLGQTCKSNESALDVYSKGGADLAFLAKTEKAADSDKLDGNDSSAFLGAAAKAADSDKLDGQDSSAFLGATATAADSEKLGGRQPFRYAEGLFARVAMDFLDVGDDQFRFIGHEAEGFYPGMVFRLECDTDGTSRVTAESDRAFSWWWDGTFGTASLVGSTYEAEFAIGNGSETHTFWSAFTDWTFPTTLDLNSQISGSTCLFGSTAWRSANTTPGP
jgi:hypothetical protein